MLEYGRLHFGLNMSFLEPEETLAKANSGSVHDQEIDCIYSAGCAENDRSI